MKGDYEPTKLLHALTWGTFDHASHAPQVRACNYYISVTVSPFLTNLLTSNTTVKAHAYY